jgi:hypothetical protein
MSSTAGLESLLGFCERTRNAVAPSNITRNELSGTIISLDTDYGKVRTGASVRVLSPLPRPVCLFLLQAALGRE